MASFLVVDHVSTPSSELCTDCETQEQGLQLLALTVPLVYDLHSAVSHITGHMPHLAGSKIAAQVKQPLEHGAGGMCHFLAVHRQVGRVAGRFGTASRFRSA